MAGGDELTWFRSKVDWWLGAILAITIAGVTVAAIAAVVTDNGALVAVIAWVGLIALFGGLVLPMRYGIGNGELVVKHGLVRQRCRLADIVEVHPTRSPLSSPALSLDRLLIKKGEGFFDSVMISPADKQGFLALLADAAGLERTGDTLRRPRGTADLE